MKFRYVLKGQVHEGQGHRHQFPKHNSSCFGLRVVELHRAVAHEERVNSTEIQVFISKVRVTVFPHYEGILHCAMSACIYWVLLETKEEIFNDLQFIIDTYCKKGIS